MENQEPFGRFIACLQRQARSYFEHALAQYGLGSGTLPVLLRLLRQDGLHQQELSAALLVDKATITRAITRLVEQGYVCREKDRTDKRAYRLFITPKAQAIAPEIKKVLHAWSMILVDGFTDDEKDRALTLLKRMRDNAMRHKKERGQDRI